MQAFEDTPARTPRPSEHARELHLVVAVAANGVIGRGNALPWHLPADLKHFRRITTGHAIVMGRRTWEAIGRPLPDRQNIVITRRADFRVPGADVVHTLDEAIARAHLPDPVYCIGGGEIFRDALPRASRLHVTEIGAHFDGDAFFPEIDRAVWRETSREAHDAGDGTPFEYAFVTYDRVA